jgi:hypothetical protein
VTDRKLDVRARPCPSCPYRQDVPSGVWHRAEYEKLIRYDGGTGEQAEHGAYGIFRCHMTPSRICAGWAGCHDMDESLAVRLNWRDIRDVRKLLDYVSPVPLFASGAEAAAHGMRAIRRPGAAALRMQRKYAERKLKRG